MSEGGDFKRFTWGGAFSLAYGVRFLKAWRC